MNEVPTMPQGYSRPSLYGKASKGFKKLKTWESCAKRGINPAEQLMRIAYLAEDHKDYSTAAGIWKELLSYIEPKMKAFDPGEDKEREAKLVTLDELRKLKTAILAGEVTAIDERTIIENKPVIQDLEVIEYKPDTDDLW